MLAELKQLLLGPDFGRQEHRTVPPNVLARFESPLGHSAEGIVHGMRFQPVDLFDWDISSNSGLVSTLLEASETARTDRTRLAVCRCDENIYRRITNMRSTPGGASLCDHYRNQMFCLSQWHGYKQAANVMWHTLYTPLYAFFYKAVYTAGTMLRTPPFAVLMLWNNALAQVMHNKDNIKYLEDAVAQKPNNPRLKMLRELLLVAIPRVRTSKPCLFLRALLDRLEKKTVVLRFFFLT